MRRMLDSACTVAVPQCHRGISQLDPSVVMTLINNYDNSEINLDEEVQQLRQSQPFFTSQRQDSTKVSQLSRVRAADHRISLLRGRGRNTIAVCPHYMALRYSAVKFGKTKTFDLLVHGLPDVPRFAVVTGNPEVDAQLRAEGMKENGNEVLQRAEQLYLDALEVVPEPRQRTGLTPPHGRRIDRDGREFTVIQLTDLTMFNQLEITRQRLSTATPRMMGARIREEAAYRKWKDEIQLVYEGMAEVLSCTVEDLQNEAPKEDAGLSDADICWLEQMLETINEEPVLQVEYGDGGRVKRVRFGEAQEEDEEDLGEAHDEDEEE